MWYPEYRIIDTCLKGRIKQACVMNDCTKNGTQCTYKEGKKSWKTAQQMLRIILWRGEAMV
jgi:hypothetical protein